MSAMSDFAKMPTQKKMLVFAGIGLALGAIYFQFVLKSLKEDVESAENDHAAKVSQSQKADKDIKEFEALKPKVNQLKAVIDQNEKALPTEAELPAFFETLNRKVVESGVEVLKFRQLPEEPIETFVKVPVEIEMTGNFMEIKKFFASLVPKRKKPGSDANGGDQGVEERERIVSIENLSLTDPTVKNREIVLTARFTATTYRQEEKTAGAPGSTPGVGGGAVMRPTAPTPAKPLAPASGSGASAPITPTSTPQGAKSAVEKSLDKGDDRNRNAAGVDEAKTPTGGKAPAKGGL